MICKRNYRNRVSHRHKNFNRISTLMSGTNITIYDMTLTDWRKAKHYTYRQAYRFIEKGQIVAIRSNNTWRVDSTSFKPQ